MKTEREFNQNTINATLPAVNMPKKEKSGNEKCFGNFLEKKIGA